MQYGAVETQSLLRLQVSPVCASAAHSPFTQRVLWSQGTLAQDSPILAAGAHSNTPAEFAEQKLSWAHTAPTALHCAPLFTVVFMAHSFAVGSQMIDPSVAPAQSNWVVQAPVSTAALPWNT